MIIHLVRHGQTIWNKDRIFQGQSDVDLTDLGRTQSRLVAAKILKYGPSAVYTSPLSRTRHIADVIANGINKTSIEVQELLELDLGMLEGKTGEDLREHWPEIIEQWRQFPSRVTMPSGESFLELHSRVTKSLYDLVDSNTESPIVIVSHNFVIKILICEILGLTVDSLHKVNIDLASVSTIEIDHDSSSLLMMNGTSHLDHCLEVQT